MPPFQSSPILSNPFQSFILKKYWFFSQLARQGEAGGAGGSEHHQATWGGPSSVSMLFHISTCQTSCQYTSVTVSTYRKNVNISMNPCQGGDVSKRLRMGDDSSFNKAKDPAKIPGIGFLRNIFACPKVVRSSPKQNPNWASYCQRCMPPGSFLKILMPSCERSVPAESAQ